MVRRVLTSPQAAEQLANAREWLTQPGSGPAGRRRWGDLKSSLRKLQRTPYMGRPDPEHAGHRRWFEHGYRVIYRVDPDTNDSATAGDVRIVAVFGPGQETDQLS